MMNANQCNMTAVRLLLTVSLLALVGCDGGTTGDETVALDQADTGIGPLSVVMVTDKGEFEIMLHPEDTPRSAANFCNLITRGFYHNKDFTAANSVARTLGDTPRRPQYQIPQEFSPSLLFDKPGVVAWTSLPRASEDSDYYPHPTRFFLTVGSQDVWNFQYVPFGTIVSGIETVQNIKVGDWIKSARVKGDPTPLFEQYADEIEEWNRELIRAGHGKPGENSAPVLPISSN